MAWWRRHRRKVCWAFGLSAGLPAPHLGLVLATRIRPPAVEISQSPQTRSWVRIEAGVREVYLEGSPEQIGAGNARLLRARMIEDEGALWSDFDHFVPWWLARIGIADWSRVRYRHLDAGVPDARRRELAAQSLAFAPDPFASRMPTYQRMLFLHALYDIALPLEHSPLIGCTSFAFPGADGHELIGRAFDFEAGEVFDRDKVVYLIREEGAVPFASVAWPGFIGVVTGMNAEGVVLVVHGARAGEPTADGMPVAFSLREALAHAHTADEAVALLGAQPVMVSHIVFVADGNGNVSIVERAPGQEAYVRRAHGRLWVTNALEGPLATDPKNLLVRTTTSTDGRAARVAELVDGSPGEHAPLRDVHDALAVLRDHACGKGPACDLGDRRAIDGLIATHGIVADATARVLWVSAGPHLSGPFVKVDLARVFAPDYDPGTDPPDDTLPEDPILHDGRYEAVMSSRANPDGSTR
jgi:isopenicillin-N N-acyltransferase like protein